MKKCSFLLFLLPGFLSFQPSVTLAADQKYTFDCARDDDATSKAGSTATEYKKHIRLTIEGDTATVNWSKNYSETATLSGQSSSFERPRFFGLPEFTDCANAGWVEVPRKMLRGVSGQIEITGKPNEDCGIGDVVYNCVSQ